MRAFAVAAAAALCIGTACTYHTVEIGYRGLRFDPQAGGMHREILQPGRYLLGHFCLLHTCGKIIDFDVTYTTSHEEIFTTSKDPISFGVNLAIVYRPIVSELYELASEVATKDYYREIVQAELRSAASRAFARRAWAEVGAD